MASVFVGPGHPADTNGDGFVTTEELLVYYSRPDAPSFAEIQRVGGPMTTDLLLFLQRRDAAVKESRRRSVDRQVERGQGLRIQLSKIKGVTKGDAAKALAVPFRFQCAPMDSFDVPSARGFEKYTNYKGTEYLSRGGTLLKAITFRTLFVERGNFVIERNYDIDDFLETLDTIHSGGWPFNLLATHQYNVEPELQIKAVLESYTRSEVAGEDDTRYVDLSFSEWRDPVVQRKGLGGRAPATEWPKYLTLARGVTNWYSNLSRLPKQGEVTAQQWTFAKLARYAYGKPSLAKHIMLSQKPAIRNYGANSPIMGHPSFKDGGTIRIPEPPPKASINKPD